MTRNKLILIIGIIVGVIGLLVIGKQFFVKQEVLPEFFPVSGQQTSDWPQLGHDAQRSNYTPESVGQYCSCTFTDYEQGKCGSRCHWEYEWVWQVPNKDCPVAIRTQPVVAEGVVAIGTHEGKMYCLDFATGQEKWSFQTGGAILHSAAIDNGRVYFGSHDGWIYAINIDNGQLAWSYKTGLGIVAAPLVVNHNVYIGSKDSYFYALKGDSGSLIWKTKIGEPVTTSAVYSANAQKIFFGTTAVRVYGLDIANGSVIWTRQLNGQSMQEAWPQVSEKHNLVIFRVLSSYDMWNNIGHAGRDIEKIFPNGQAGSLESEQEAISQYLINNPHRRTFYALKTNDGSDRYSKPVPVLWTWGVSSTMHAQAIDDEHDQTWAVWRSLIMPTRDTVDTGLLDLATGRFKDHLKWGYIDTWGLIQSGIPADEPRPISAAADTWFTAQSFGPSGCYLADGSCFTTLKVGGWMEFHDDPEDKNWQGMWLKSWIRGQVAPIWTNGRLLWNGHGGIGCLKQK